MKKKLLLSLTLFVVSVTVYAQRNNTENQLYYEIISNDPAKAKKIAAYLDLLNLDVYKPNSDLTMGYKIGVDARLLKDNIFLEGHYKNTYLDRISEGINLNSFYGIPQNGTDAQMGFGGTATYNIVNKSREKKYDVTIKSSGRIRYYTLVPAQEKMCMGIRLGMERFRTEYQFDNGISGKVIDKDSAYNTTSQGLFTMMKYYTINVGFSRTLVGDLKVKLNYDGIPKTMIRNKNYVTRIYFDVMIAPKVTLDNVSIPLTWNGNSGGSQAVGFYNFHLVDLSGMKINPVGFRVGYEEISLARVGFSYGAEFGLRPGPSQHIADNFYLTIKFGMSLSFLAGK